MFGFFGSDKNKKEELNKLKNEEEEFRSKIRENITRFESATSPITVFGISKEEFEALTVYKQAENFTVEEINFLYKHCKKLLEVSDIVRGDINEIFKQKASAVNILPDKETRDSIMKELEESKKKSLELHDVIERVVKSIKEKIEKVQSVL